MRVYVAGPLYSSGLAHENIQHALEAGDAILDAGHVPFVPHLYFFWSFYSNKHDRTWLQLDMAWLDACDVLVRLPGKSLGADLEVDYARNAQKSVFLGLSEFLAFARKLEERPV